MTTRRSRPVATITRRDLALCPVWEFIAEPRGRETEEWVRPRPRIARLDVRALRSSHLLIVAAVFRLADGSTSSGYVTPAARTPASADGHAPDDDYGYLGTAQPVILTSRGPLSFWLGMFGPTAAERARLLRTRLGRPAPSIFPIRYRAIVPCTPGIRADGMVPGFLGRERQYVFTT